MWWQVKKEPLGGEQPCRFEIEQRHKHLKKSGVLSRFQPVKVERLRTVDQHMDEDKAEFDQEYAV